MFSIEELYRYSSSVRRRFVERLDGLPWEEVVRNREASHHSMRNIAVHMIQNEDWMVGWVIRGRTGAYERADPEEFKDMASVRRYLEEVEGRTSEYIGLADEAEMRRRVDFTLRPGMSFDLSVEECLFQSFTEQVFHIGELIALLWQDDLEPPKMQWFWNNPRSPA